MKKLTLALLLVLVILIDLGAQNNAGQGLNHFYPLLRPTFESNRAYQTVAFIEQRWRIAGNSGFNESIGYIETILKQAGYKKEVNDETEGPLTYRIEKRKMNRPTWEPISASLSLEGEKTPLLQFITNRNMIAINSASTPAEGITAEVIYVGKGAKEDFEGKDVKGKIVFGESGVRSLYTNAIKAGAIGVIAYSMPAYTQPEKYINSIQFQSIPYQDSINQKWGLLLSYQAKEKIKEAVRKGPFKLTVNIKTKLYTSEELTIIANARGSSLPDERFVFSAHVQEPGANDNATGVGTLAEMARVTADLIQQKKFAPERTITFLWGDEIVSTDRYIKDDKARAKGIKWGLSLDMVGEDVLKTGGTFLIEKMPDPSAIWTRGKEKHTEWGGSVLKELDMFPHYFNDFLLNRCRQQGKENNWIVNANPFEGGSDHTPFLQAKIPGLLMWHFTDKFYHTDADRLEMVSEEEMKNVGISALATAMILSSADETTTILITNEVLENSIQRLQAEFELSRDAIANGSSVQSEQHILEVWAYWYKVALEKTIEINCGGPTKKIKKQITEAITSVDNRNKELISNLKK